MSHDTGKLGQTCAINAHRSRTTGSISRRRRIRKAGIFLLSLFLFLLAILLMKEGAYGLASLVETMLQTATPLRSLGFGWLFAYLVLSGSPVAAAAITFLAAGAIDVYAALAMITGSRLGACFIVLLFGFFYVARGRNRATSLDIGLLTFGVTTTTFMPALLVGFVLLRAGLSSSTPMGVSTRLASVVDLIFTPIVSAAAYLLPSWGLFLAGMAIIMVSFSLFDRCLPDMTLRDSQVGQVSRLVYNPWIMFTLGGAVTLISMSVSVSLGVLVPLSQRGFIRRENVIPYIMGANVTTFVDTLLAALLLADPRCFGVVLASMISTTLISVSILMLCYHHYQRTILAFSGWATRSNRNFLIFLIAIFLMPILLLLL